MQSGIVLNKKKLIICLLLYIYIPICIFLFGWTKCWISISCFLVISFCFVSFIKNTEEKNEDVYISKKVFLFSLLFLFVIGYFAGWGRFVDQASDWAKHNAIMYDLTNRKWPVYYCNNVEKSMLTYYIGQYMFPALIGKIFCSTRVTEIANYIYAEIGLVLVYIYLISILKIKENYKQIIALFVLVFFCLPFPLAKIISEFFYPGLAASSNQWYIYTNDLKIQYSANYIMLRWVYCQTIVIWASMLLLLDNKDKINYYIFLLLPSLFFGILPFVGIVYYAIGYAVFSIFKTDIKNIIKRVLSLENILLMFSLGFVFFTYYYGNVFGAKDSTISFGINNYGDYLGLYFILVIICIGIYAIILYKKNNNSIFFYLTILYLVVLPMFKMGAYNDLVMRGSIPALFLYAFYTIEYLCELKLNTLNKRICFVFVASMLFIGFTNQYEELNNSIINEDYTKIGIVEDYIEWTTMEDFANRSNNNIPSDIKYNYYSYDIEDNIFCKYISRK